MASTEKATEVSAVDGFTEAETAAEARITELVSTAIG